MNPNDIVTDHQLKVSFDDETKCILISTPKGNTIELNDSLDVLKLSDIYQNSITLGKDGIHISSSSQVSISGVNIKFDAIMNLEMNASSEITSKAANIKHYANAQFIAQGSASAELSSSGQSRVQGSIVMIN